MGPNTRSRGGDAAGVFDNWPIAKTIPSDRWDRQENDGGCLPDAFHPRSSEQIAWFGRVIYEPHGEAASLSRDATLMLLAYRHGLRVSELVALRWEQVDFKAGLLHVNRNKNGIASVHPLRGPELRALRRMKREDGSEAYTFMTERGGPMTTDNVRKLVQRAAQEANLPFPVHPHMLRHACGYKLANDGHDTRAIQHHLGHQSIQNTVRYTQLAAGRFKDFWRD